MRSICKSELKMNLSNTRSLEMKNEYYLYINRFERNFIYKQFDIILIL
jgi:hypothetical protein